MNKSWNHHPLFINVGATLSLLVSTPDENFTCAGLSSSVKTTTANLINFKIQLTQMSDQKRRVAELDVAIIDTKLTVSVIAESKNMTQMS